jgi:hypothetical protein
LFKVFALKKLVLETGSKKMFQQVTGWKTNFVTIGNASKEKEFYQL